MTESENNELRIAVIGAGPAGVYSSDIFLRQLKKLGEELGLGTKARIDLFEKLPVPFGLVRYGVAPDHPSIKFIASALEKTLDNPDIHLYCDVEFGKDVTLDDLLARYDAVLFATGAVKDKPLNLPGADLDGVYGAAKFVEWYDGYPTGAREWPLSAENVAVIGGGNVAMDVARELMRNADDSRPRPTSPTTSTKASRETRPRCCICSSAVASPRPSSACRNCVRWRSCPACSSSSTRTTSSWMTTRSKRPARTS